MKHSSNLYKPSKTHEDHNTIQSNLVDSSNTDIILQKPSKTRLNPKQSQKI